MNTTALTVENLKFICREKELKGYSKHTTKSALLTFIRDSGVDISTWEKLGKKKEVVISKPKKKEVKEVKESIDEKSSVDSISTKLLYFFNEEEPTSIFEDKKTSSKKEELSFLPKKSDMVIHLQNTENGSSKFWKITYPTKAIKEKESSTKFSYKVNYGKIDKTSTESVSEGTFKDIQKLIASKEKKGYVQVK
jgi:predicted DNA-binding WGR domain protein